METEAAFSDPTARSRRDAKQPLHAVQIAGALLKIQTVVAVTGMSSSSIRRKVALDEFPQPLKFGKRCTRWKADAVSAWLRKQGGAA